MLKKKDSKKPFWKRLIKSTEKVNIYFSNLICISLHSVNGSPLIGIIFLLKVNFIDRRIIYLFFQLDEDDDTSLDGAGGKDWSNLGKIFSPAKKNIFIQILFSRWNA